MFEISHTVNSVLNFIVSDKKMWKIFKFPSLILSGQIWIIEIINRVIFLHNWVELLHKL